MSKAKRHTHKYYRVKLTFGKVWACALPDCNHHMPPHMEGMLPGKQTECWKCGETTIMDIRTMKMEKPLCDDCDTNNPATMSVEALAEAIKKAGLNKEAE